MDSVARWQIQEALNDRALRAQRDWKSTASPNVFNKRHGSPAVPTSGEVWTSSCDVAWHHRSVLWSIV